MKHLKALGQDADSLFIVGIILLMGVVVAPLF